MSKQYSTPFGYVANEQGTRQYSTPFGVVMNEQVSVASGFKAFWAKPKSKIIGTGNVSS